MFGGERPREEIYEATTPTEESGNESLAEFFNDGMDPVSPPKIINRENMAHIFGGALPDIVSPEIFEDGGELELTS